MGREAHYYCALLPIIGRPTSCDQLATEERGHIPWKLQDRTWIMTDATKILLCA